MAKKWVACMSLLLAGCGSKSISTTKPLKKSGIVPIADRNGVPLNSVLPANFDPSKTYPWVIFDHGSDQLGAAILQGRPANPEPFHRTFSGGLSCRLLQL
jgi:hypothetical protein